MCRHRLFALVLLALCVVLVVVAGSALAASMTLPEFVTKSSWTGSDGASVWKASGVELKCKSGTNNGEMEASKKLGTFTITFKECSSAITGTECNSEGDAAGVVLTLGSWHLVLTTKAGEDRHLIWFLFREFVLKCGTVSITLKGNLLGEITPANKLTKAYAIKIETAGPTTQQEYTSFENDSGATVSASLLTAGALGFHATTLAAVGNTITTALDTLIIN
jgi:hypothetical protein